MFSWVVILWSCFYLSLKGKCSIWLIFVFPGPGSMHDAKKRQPTCLEWKLNWRYWGSGCWGIRRLTANQLRTPYRLKAPPNSRAQSWEMVILSPGQLQDPALGSMVKSWSRPATGFLLNFQPIYLKKPEPSHNFLRITEFQNLWFILTSNTKHRIVSALESQGNWGSLIHSMGMQQQRLLVKTTKYELQLLHLQLCTLSLQYGFTRL